jgi:hypothetical protein
MEAKRLVQFRIFKKNYKDVLFTLAACNHAPIVQLETRHIVFAFPNKPNTKMKSSETFHGVFSYNKNLNSTRLFGSNPVPDKYCNKTHFNRFIICQLK